MIPKRMSNTLVQTKVGLMTDRFLYRSDNGDIEVVATGRYVERVNQLLKPTVYVEISPADDSSLWAKFVPTQELALIKHYTLPDSIIKIADNSL
jgi:hypothetical protein